MGKSERAEGGGAKKSGGNAATGTPQESVGGRQRRARKESAGGAGGAGGAGWTGNGVLWGVAGAHH